MMNPSYDLSLFDVNQIGPLQAHSIGATTFFNANMPTSFVDNSLNTLMSFLEASNPLPFPQNQFPVDFKSVPNDVLFQSQRPKDIYGNPIPSDATVAQESQTNKRKAALDRAKEQLEKARKALTICVTASGRTVGPDDPDAIHCWGARPGPAAKTNDQNKPSSTGWFSDFIDSLPAGAGIFLLGIIIVILLILFASRK